jgi:sulfite exporter TauE/SafE
MDVTSAMAAGLLLGLSSGGQCFWSCAAVLGPYLAAAAPEVGSGPRWATLPTTLRAVAWYNLGRLLAYLATALAVAALTRAELSWPAWLQAATRLLTAMVLGASLLRPTSTTRCCSAQRRARGAFALGVLQGITPCAPFLAAAGLAFSSALAPAAAVGLFLALFVGTALFTLPLAFIEPIRRRPRLTWALRLLGALVCVHLVASAAVALVAR